MWRDHVVPIECALMIGDGRDVVCVVRRVSVRVMELRFYLVFTDFSRSKNERILLYFKYQKQISEISTRFSLRTPTFHPRSLAWCRVCFAAGRWPHGRLESA